MPRSRVPALLRDLLDRLDRLVSPAPAPIPVPVRVEPPRGRHPR